MMNTKVFYVVSYSLVLSPVFMALNSAQSAPRKYTQCAQIQQIKSPASSAGFYMSEDCKTAYVLPPAIGKIDLAGYVDELGEGGQLCSVLGGDMRLISRSIKNDQAELDSNELQLQAIHEDLVQLATSCVEVELVASSSEAKLIQNRESQRLAQVKIDQLTQDLTSCDPIRCESIRSDRDRFSDQLSLLKVRETGIVASYDRSHALMNTCLTRKNKSELALNQQKTQLDARNSLLKSSMSSQNRAAVEMFESQRSAPGALMSVTISSEQTALVNEFRKLNAQLAAVQFVEMPLNNISLSFTQIQDGVSAGYPILLKANISGIRVNPDNSLQTRPSPVGAENSDSVIFGAAVSGSMTLNRFGACQLPPKDNYGNSSSSQRQRAKDIAGLIGATATYQFQLGVSRKVKVFYNEKQLYCLIKKQSSSNGLFRSSSSSSITETSQLNQWLVIDVNSEDTGFDFADRETLAMDLRRELLDRSLMNVATSYLSKERAQIIAPGDPAAGQIAGQLRKCPNLYCQFGAIALDLGNALFGGTSSASSTCQDVGAMSEQLIIDTKPIVAYGTQAFKIQGK